MKRNEYKKTRVIVEYSCVNSLKIKKKESFLIFPIVNANILKQNAICAILRKVFYFFLMNPNTPDTPLDTNPVSPEPTNLPATSAAPSV